MSNCLNTAPIPVCVTLADGSKATFIEHVIYEKGAPIGQGYTTADDTEALLDPVAEGWLEIAPGSCPMPQPDVEWETLCDVQADGTSVEFMCRTITNFDSTYQPVEPADVDYFEIDKVTAYVPTGTVAPCVKIPPDVEWELLCDEQADGTFVEYMCQTITSWDGTGAAIVPSMVTTYEMDKVTPYAVTGTPGKCDDCQPVGSLGTVTAWSDLS